jgi:valyl-tRNA synthetase
MSKSLGNGIDPIDVINTYGVDALRYFITTNSTPGLDMRYSEEKMKSSQNYLNKIWNATRYVEMTLGEDYVPEEVDPKKCGVLEKFILSRLQDTIKRVSARMESFEFGQASSILYDFVYDDFCSYYLEMSKVSMANEAMAPTVKATLYKVIRSIILMIYPYTPFIGEELYLSLPGHKESIMLESYPEVESKFVSKAFEKRGALLREILSDVRNYKASHKIAPNAPIKLTLSPKSPFDGIENYLARFLFAKTSFSKDGGKGDSFVYSGYTLYVEEDIDPSLIKGRLEEAKSKLEFEIARSEKMLSNPGFLAKAPKAKIDLEKSKLEENKAKLESVKKSLAELN